MHRRIILIIVFIIASFNSVSISAKEKPEQDQEEEEELTFKEAVKDFASVMKGLRKYMKKESKRRQQEQKDINLLAEVIYWENWHTDKEHLAAYYTGAVVMNRVKSSKWPDTVYDVLYQKRQYSTTGYFFTKELPQEVYEMAADIIRNGTPDVPYNVVYQATFVQGSGDWIDPINGEHFCYGGA